MASKRKKKPKKASAPTVSDFLSKISSPNKASGTPAKGLLGDLSRDELAAARDERGTAEDVDEIDAIDVDLTSLDDGEPVADFAAQRRAPRIPTVGKVSIRGLFGGSEREDNVTNASLYGVFVETADLLDVGDPVELTFALQDGRKLKVNGRVRWVSPFGGLKDARPGMGIELIGIEGEKKEALNALLKRKT